MSRKTYAVVGSWFYRPGPMGISLMEYNLDSGQLRLLQTKYPEINADFICLNKQKCLVYATDTCATPKGGYLATLRIDTKEESLQLLSREATLFRDPDYLFLDKNHGDYLFVSHHSDAVLVNKLVRLPNGDLDVETKYDDVGVDAFRLGMDGVPDKLCDVALTSTDKTINGDHQFSREHSVVADPTGELLVVCDKGLDCLYTFHFDRQTERFIPLQVFQLQEQVAPRYGIFHPTLPIFYCSCEKKLAVLAFSYDCTSGKMEQIEEFPLPEPEGRISEGKIESGDILINSEKSVIYVSVRGLDQIMVLKIQEDGLLSFKQEISCGGVNPRCFCLAPDGRFLLCGNMESETIRTLKILDDGTLELTNYEEHVTSPSAIAIL